MQQTRVFIGAAGLIGLASGLAYGANFTKIVGSGTAVPGQSTNFTETNLGAVDGAYGAAFVGTFTVSGQTYSGLYRTQNNVITPLADRSISGPAGETIDSIIANGDYENGVIVFAAETTAGRAMYRYTPGQPQPLTALVRQGDVLPGSTSPVNTFYLRGVSGDANEFAFGTARADTTTAFYTTVSGFPMLSADDKTRSPIAETGDFIDFPELHYRNGKTAFIGRGADPDWPGPGPAPIEPAGVFITSPGNPIEIISGRGFEIPVSTGPSTDYRFREFERPRLMPDGRVAFAGGYIDENNPNDPNAPRNMGVFIRNPDLTWKSYISSDMVLPGMDSEIQEFNQFSLETGINFFGVNDITGGSYIYYESLEGVFTKLIGTNDVLVAGKTTNRIRMLSDTAIGGEIFFRAAFTDGTDGIFTAVVPEPASAGLFAAAVTTLAACHRPRR